MHAIARPPCASRSLRVAVVLAALLLGLVPMPAAAQSVFDHLACHPIRDTLPRGSVRADLFPAQSELFPAAAGCRVKLPAKLFCEDVQKRNVQPPAPLVVDGEQTRKYFCYSVACPRGAGEPDAGGFDAADQFGSRWVQARRPRMLCAPANMLLPTPVPTSTPPPAPPECGDSYPQCNGACYPSTTVACIPFDGGCACIYFTPNPTNTARTPTPSPTP